MGAEGIENQKDVRVSQDRLVELRDNLITFINDKYASYLGPDNVKTVQNASARLNSSYPVTAVFLALFALFSIVPVLTFLAFATTIIAGFVLTAVGIALAAASFVLFFAGGFLLLVLVLTFNLALFFSFAVFAFFTTYRLFQRTRTEGRAGIAPWAEEVKTSIGYPPKPSQIRAIWAEGAGAEVKSEEKESNEKGIPNGFRVAESELTQSQAQ